MLKPCSFMRDLIGSSRFRANYHECVFFLTHIVRSLCCLLRTGRLYHLIQINFVFHIVPLNYPAFSNVKVVHIVSGGEEKARQVKGRIG